VEPVPEPLLLKKFGSAGNQALTSGSVATNRLSYGMASAMC
jgi:hypothetical protein